MTDVDLSELDEWLGTLEELQLGLESAKPLLTQTKVKVTSHINPTFTNETNVTGKCRNSALSEFVNPKETTLFDRLISETNHYSKHKADLLCDTLNRSLTQGQQAQFNSEKLTTSSVVIDRPPMVPNGRNLKEARTPECDLNNLIRELEVVEEHMKEMEQENSNFTRRYSLNSASGLSHRPSNSQTDAQNSQSLNVSNHNCSRLGNGLVSVQWAADLNRDSRIRIESKEPSPTPLPPPPAFLGAGDAVASLPNSPQPPSSLFTELWIPDRDQSSEPVAVNSDANGSTPSQPILMYIDSSPLVARQDSKSPTACDSVKRSTAQLTNIHSNHPNRQQQDVTLSQCSNIEHSGSNNLQISAPVNPVSHQTNNLHTTANYQQVCHVNTTHVDPNLYSSQPPNNINQFAQSQIHSTATFGLASGPLLSPPMNRLNRSTREFDEDSSLSGLGNWSPICTIASQNGVGRVVSFVEHAASEVLSNSLSPESSISDKSLSYKTDSNSQARTRRTEIQVDSVKKLVVRVFRPDKTTKAVLIEESMTAGEVANMMIEKNFLPPSTALAVVEKVPTLKIERVFEEHDKVADCILMWPAKSQNMIFFERREDHFGFIESPLKWFSEEMTAVHGYNSTHSVQNMLNNLDQAGLPELRDYLYLRKPGEKTWSRKLCVLRTSGLYTSKRNKKVLEASDLSNVLVLDSPLQIYVTTGGWTRMKSPTPYGFALKPYSASDLTSTELFCFCAADERSLRYWVCRLRIAKYGKQLLHDYQSASNRIRRLVQLKQTWNNSKLAYENGSSSAYDQQKSTFDMLPSSSDPNLSAADSTTSLLTADELSLVKYDSYLSQVGASGPTQKNVAIRYANANSLSHAYYQQQKQTPHQIEYRPQHIAPQRAQWFPINCLTTSTTSPHSVAPTQSANSPLLCSRSQFNESIPIVSYQAHYQPQRNPSESTFIRNQELPDSGRNPDGRFVIRSTMNQATSPTQRIRRI